MLERRLILRGVIAGAFAGLLAAIFTRVMAEPVIQKSINYESAHDAIEDRLRAAAHLAPLPPGPDIFSRSTQRNIGAPIGLIVFGAAMGALFAVVFILAHRRYGDTLKPRVLAVIISAFTFLGIYMVPYLKYPANPPAIGHTFTIVTRGHLYLLTVGASIVLLGLAVYLTRVLLPRLGLYRSVLLSAAAFLVAYGVLIGLLPSLGGLSANLAHSGQFGYARAATETPQPITNVLGRSLVVHGRSYAPGQLVYPGFDADVLWKFRWYSLLNQLLIWTTIAVVFGALVDRFVVGRDAPSQRPATDTAVPVG